MPLCIAKASVSGYPRPKMAKHVYKVGRPPRAEGPTRTYCFRLSEDEGAALDAHVELGELSRSELIRDALDAQGLLVPPKKR
jgi:Ribbon-helix-helix protein, copG family